MEKNVRLWKSNFKSLLSSSKLPPTSKFLAHRISIHLGGSVSVSLVQKWRTEGSGSRVPTHAGIANALVDALIEIGVFDSFDMEEAYDIQNSLVESLGFRRVENCRLRIRYAFLRALDAVAPIEKPIFLSTVATAHESIVGSIANKANEAMLKAVLQGVLQETEKFLIEVSDSR